MFGAVKHIFDDIRAYVLPSYYFPAVNSVPKVAIIILNWRQTQETLDCVDALDRSSFQDFNVFVVENGSGDQSAERFHQEWLTQTERRIHLIESNENLGFAGGCNLGISVALSRGAEFIVLLNNDARVTSDTIGALVDGSLKNDAALVGAVVRDRSTLEVLFVRRQWPHHLFGIGRRQSLFCHLESWPSYGVDGCLMLVRRDILEKRLIEYGYYFDPDLFLYWEDVDLSQYIISRGHRCVVASNAVVYHSVARSSGGWGNPRSYYYLTRNRVLVANRWLGPILKIAFHIFYLSSRPILALYRLLHGNKSASFAILQGLYDGYRGKLGRWSRHDKPNL